ncbi:Lauroyl/myristoyl acyltransferase [Actinokineospora spheciospongiae]|uniref:Lauroyl/myristoyl acyltransferase n=1 Tax=Actinokineospora spheciospongiae TaxID=909613 RepID=W7IWT7_9PSEU|nr:phosphatidylinositol mannoside acyltransferase [Actinokineospora spheciospongiae]EWC61282.1 Lauroyl/myristoyl acyltransferase [Actinokineospora spheciospongiae]PWW62397.1 KDO2-lipid IV(A) lauroyltransferase [Actinokineospora spheciospongiae]
MSGLAATAYGLGWRLVRLLPEAAAKTLFRAGADWAARRGGPGARRLRANLARVVPQAGPEELDALVREGLRSYARYWMETFRLPTMDVAAIHANVAANITGAEYITAGLAEGNGVVIALTHSGNWDAAGTWLVREHGSFTTVVERLKPESLFEKFVAYRESLGFEILPAEGGARMASVVMAERLRENRVVCLVGDRDLSPRGIPVTFFGQPAQLPAGPAYLAARTGAVLLPAGVWFTDDGWAVRIHPPVPVGGVKGIPAATQALADVFAADIGSHPADWHMLQPVWTADKEAARAAAAGESPR